MGSNQVSRLTFWVGWIFPALIILLMCIWKSTWGLIPTVGGNDLYLGIVFFAIAIVAVILHFLAGKKRPNWRFNLYLVFVFAMVAGIMLVLDYYFAWSTTLWF